MMYTYDVCKTNLRSFFCRTVTLKRLWKFVSLFWIDIAFFQVRQQKLEREERWWTKKGILETNLEQQQKQQLWLDHSAIASQFHVYLVVSNGSLQCLDIGIGIYTVASSGKNSKNVCFFYFLCFLSFLTFCLLRQSQFQGA